MKCFEFNKNCNKKCDKKECRYWIDLEKNQNCCINAAAENDENEDNLTLQDIGNIFNVTRMRICQIEKIAIQKLKEKLTGFNVI